MDFKDCIENFPWNRFGTPYETNSKELKNKFIKILNGNSESKDYKFIIDRIEHQETLYRITPWGLKFYTILLSEEKSAKSILLQNINTLFIAANYNTKCDNATKYEPTKGNLKKYEEIKTKLFDDEFDGILNAEYLKIYKTIDRHFMQISIMEYILDKKPFYETFLQSNNLEIKNAAKSLINSINNPERYKFISEDGVEEWY